MMKKHMKNRYFNQIIVAFCKAGVQRNNNSSLINVKFRKSDMIKKKGEKGLCKIRMELIKINIFASHSIENLDIFGVRE